MDDLKSNLFGDSSHNEDVQAPPQSQAQQAQSAYTSDMSMYLAWENWNLTNYSWMMYNRALAQQNAHQAAMLASWYQNVHQQQGGMGTSSSGTTSQPQQTQGVQQQGTPTVHADATIVVKLASMHSRVAAELIDFLILIVLKVFMIYYIYGHQYIERFNLIHIIDDTTAIEDLEWMLIQAGMFRLVVVLYEGYMLSGTLPLSRGVTIGKSLMGVKVVYCEKVEDTHQLDQSVRLTRMRPLGAARSCYRALLKNVAISLLFPMLLPIMVFSHNRLLYDVTVGSVAIQDDRRGAGR